MSTEQIKKGDVVWVTDDEGDLALVLRDWKKRVKPGATEHGGEMEALRAARKKIYEKMNALDDKALRVERRMAELMKEKESEK